MKLIAISIALAFMATACSNKDEPVVPPPVPVTKGTCVVEFDTNKSVAVCTCTEGAEITSCPDWSTSPEFPAEVVVPGITEAKP